MEDLKEFDSIPLVAAAVMEWGRDNEANVYTHWFQPLGAYVLMFSLFPIDLISSNQERCQAWHDRPG